MLKRYPYDPTGRSTDNLVSTERHTLSGNGGDILFPRYGAFFNDSLVVKQGEKKLIFNQDYQLSFFWQDATVKVGAPISMAFQILNDRLIGEIQIDYQVVGGEYQGTIEAIEQLKKTLPKMHRNVFWDDVINKPEAWVPTRHLHNIDDIFGLTPLALALEELRRSLEHQSVLKLKTVYDRFLKLKQYVENTLNQPRSNDDLNQILTKVNEKIQEAIRNLDLTTAMNQLETKILSSVDTKYNGSIKSHENMIRNLMRESLERLDQITTQRDELGALAKKYRIFSGTVETFMTNANGKFTEIDNKFNQINTKFNEVDLSVTSKVHDAETSLNTVINNAITNLENKLNKKISTLSNTSSSSPSTPSISQQELDDLKTKLDQEIQNRTSEDASIKSGLEQYKTFLTQKRDEQSNRIGALEQKHNQLETRVNDLDARDNASTSMLQTNFNNLSNRVDQLEKWKQGANISGGSGNSGLRGGPINIEAGNNGLRGGPINIEAGRSVTLLSDPSSNNYPTFDPEDFVIKSTFNDFKNELDINLNSLTNDTRDIKTNLPTIESKITQYGEQLQRVEEHFRTIEKTARNAANKDAEHDRILKDLLKRMYVMDGGNNPTNESMREEFYKSMEQSVNEAIERYRQEFNDTTNKIQADLNQVGSVNPDELNRTIKKILDQKIAEERIASPEFNLTRLNITPDVPTEQTISGGKYITSNIIYMADDVDKTEVIAFAPTTTFEWTASSTWVIPDKYNDMIAQVHLTTPLKWQQQPTRFEPNGTALTPSTKVAYIRLKSGIPIDLTIGDVVSFGTIFSNDGVSDHRMVTPGILMNSNAIPTNTIGSYGKITVIV
nr:MAG TPA: structural protein [Caudoviricetes sp.]